MICIIFTTFGIFVQLLDKNSLIVWFYASGFSETKSYYHTNDAEISKTHVSKYDTSLTSCFTNTTLIFH